MSVISRLWGNIEAKAKPLFTEAEQEASIFFNAAVSIILKNGGIVLVAAARDAVKAVGSSAGSNEEKFKAAVSFVIDALKAKGIPVVMNAINIAVETAVADLHA